MIAEFLILSVYIVFMILFCQTMSVNHHGLIEWGCLDCDALFCFRCLSLSKAYSGVCV